MVYLIANILYIKFYSFLSTIIITSRSLNIYISCSINLFQLKNIYYISLLVVVILFTYISIRYSLNYSNTRPIKNNPIQATQSIVIANFKPSYITLKCIQVRNPLSFNFFPKNCLIKGNLTFTILILLILSSNTLLLSYK